MRRAISWARCALKRCRRKAAPCRSRMPFTRRWPSRSEVEQRRHRLKARERCSLRGEEKIMRHKLVTRAAGLVAASLLIAACATQVVTPTTPPPEVKTVFVTTAPEVIVLTPTPPPAAQQPAVKKTL